MISTNLAINEIYLYVIDQDQIKYDQIKAVVVWVGSK